MIDQVPLGQLTTHSSLDCNIASIKSFVLALNYEMQLLRLNSSVHIEVVDSCRIFTENMVWYIQECFDI